jgi:dihydropyrimidinase
VLAGGDSTANAARGGGALLIRGGRVVTAAAVADVDVEVRDGVVATVAERIAPRGHTVVDATGLLVLPGVIDPHTHFGPIEDDRTPVDDFESGSRAAAAGGVTCFVNYAFPEGSDPIFSTLERLVDEAGRASHVDFSFHPVICHPSAPSFPAELTALADAGFSSVKIFTALAGLELSDREILTVLDAAAERDLMVNVHAEDGAMVDHLTQRLLDEGRHELRHLRSARPPEAEATAIARVAEYARVVNCPLYVVHLTSRAGLEAIVAARARGGEIYAETRPVHLLLDGSLYEGPAPASQRWVTWPPFRSQEDRDALWGGLARGQIEVCATDHTARLLRDKTVPGLSFDRVPGGLAGVQTTLGLLYSEGVRTGRLSLNQLVEVLSANAAKLFGLWPRKGTIAVGSDADLVLLDPNRRVTIAAESLESNSDFEAFEGHRVTGWPVATFSRGELIYANGEIRSSPGRGQLVRRTCGRDQLAQTPLTDW